MVITIAALALASPVRAADEPKGYSCSFASGVAFAYANGAFAPDKPAPVAFEIAAVDTAAQTAELRSGGGARPLRTVMAVNAIHFIEVVAEGFLNLTTVYDRDDSSKRHPAVHSRHFGLLGQPVVAQYHGFCEAR